MQKFIGVSIVLLMMSVLPARAQIQFGTIVERSIDQVIIPGYADFYSKSEKLHSTISALCQSPDAAKLESARSDFSTLVSAFARIEPYRFGPSRAENRQERLFFWPDRRSRGLRQVQALIAKADYAGLEPEKFIGKSVAVQGLLALDFILADPAVDLLSDSAAFTCKYAQTVSGAIQKTAQQIHDDWAKPGGYGDLMRNAGPDNPVYRTSAEAVQELLRAAKEQLQIVRDLKLLAILKETTEKTKPKRSPFWRSDNSFSSYLENINGVITLIEKSGLNEILPEDEAALPGQFVYELKLVQRVLNDINDRDGRLIEKVKDKNIHASLVYASHPLKGAMVMLNERYPEALGLTMGFNSLDGD